MLLLLVLLPTDEATVIDSREREEGGEVKTEFYVHYNECTSP